MEHIQENLINLHKKTINYVLTRKAIAVGKDYLEDNTQTIQASPPKN